VSSGTARTLAAAGTAGTGAAAAAAAYLLVGGLPGMLYAAGIGLAALFGAVVVVAGRTRQAARLELELEPTAPPKAPRWRRKSRIIAELEVELAATGAELEEHRQALAKLAEQRARESETAHRNAERLEQRIRELETERDDLNELVARERERFEQTLDSLGGDIGRHGSELAAIERELEALIAR
jgi:DNA repair exonuclease SbcCD ATPase subunit